MTNNIIKHIPTLNPIRRNFLKNAAPFGLQIFSYQLSVLANIYLLGQLGEEELASFSPSWGLYNAIIGTASSILFIAGVYAKDSSLNRKDVFESGLAIATGLATSSSLVLGFSESLLLGMGQSLKIAFYGAEFLRGYTLSGGIFSTLPLVLSHQFCYALKAPYRPLQTTILSKPLQIGLSAYLMLGQPKWGPFGLGFATAMSSHFEFLLHALAFRFGAIGKKHNICQQLPTLVNLKKLFSRNPDENLPIGLDMLAKGFGISILSIFEIGTSVAMIIIIGALAPNELPALSIALTYRGVVGIGMYATGQTTALFTQENKGDYRYLQALKRIALQTTLALPMLFIPFVALMPTQLISPFIKENDSHAEETAELSLKLIWLMAVFTEFPDAIKRVFSGVHYGFKENKDILTVSGINTLTAIASIPLGFLLNTFLEDTSIAFATSTAIATTITALYLSRTGTKRINEINPLPDNSTTSIMSTLKNTYNSCTNCLSSFWNTSSQQTNPGYPLSEQPSIAP